MRSFQIRCLRAFTFGCAFAVGMALAAPAADFTPTEGDEDGDGVVDAMDQCPDTPFLDLVTTSGCSACPCDYPWSSHDAYLACVNVVVKQRRAARTITSKQVRAAVQHAKHSTCGDLGLIRCCVHRYPVPDSPVSCTLKSPAECDSNVLGKVAENLGPGSCLPNPCLP